MFVKIGRLFWVVLVSGFGDYDRAVVERKVVGGIGLA